MLLGLYCSKENKLQQEAGTHQQRGHLGCDVLAFAPWYLT